MKFTILGAGSGLPHPNFHLSSIVVQTNDHNFLLDCGEGTSKQLVRNGFNLDFIDAVLISHNHPDHASGLYMLIQMLYLENRTKPLKLFLPERPDEFIESLQMFYTFEHRLPFKLHVHEMKEAESQYSEISVALTDHLLGYREFLLKHNFQNQMKSYCFAITEEERSLLYTSDINTLDNINHLLDKATLIIIDALHPDAKLIIRLADDKARQLILTHGISDTLMKWTKENPRDNVKFALESKTLIV